MKFQDLLDDFLNFPLLKNLIKKLKLLSMS